MKQIHLQRYLKREKRHGLQTLHTTFSRIFRQIQNLVFKVYEQGIVTYEQTKLRLYGYYDKTYVFLDGIYTRCSC